MDGTSEPLTKAFIKAADVLPFTKYGVSTIGEFKEAEKQVQQLEFLKRVGLTDDEIKLYKDYEAGTLDGQTKIDKTILQEKLNDVLARVSSYKEKDNNGAGDAQPSTSSGSTAERLVENLEKQSNSTNLPTYPAGHPMNEVKQLEDNLFGHHKDDALPLTKRRKILRHLERRQQQLEAAERDFLSTEPRKQENKNGHSLWDVKKVKKVEDKPVAGPSSGVGPSKTQTMYTIRDSKIVKLEPPAEHETGEAVDIVVPVNETEPQLLEGTKISVDEIRKMDRFKDYEPGIPSKVLYLKNLAPSATQEQVSILFNQFLMDNGGPINVRLMTGRMRGQAFVRFNHDHVAIQALEEINGTVLSGRPIIAEFGRNSNRIQMDEDR